MHFSVKSVLIIIKNSCEYTDSPGNSASVMILCLKAYLHQEKSEAKTKKIKENLKAIREKWQISKDNKVHTY